MSWPPNAVNEPASETNDTADGDIPQPAQRRGNATQRTNRVTALATPHALANPHAAVRPCAPAAGRLGGRVSTSWRGRHWTAANSFRGRNCALASNAPDPVGPRHEPGRMEYTDTITVDGHAYRLTARSAADRCQITLTAAEPGVDPVQVTGTIPLAALAPVGTVIQRALSGLA